MTNHTSHYLLNALECQQQQQCRKALKSGGGGAQRLNTVDLYGKNLIPMEKL